MEAHISGDASYGGFPRKNWDEHENFNECTERFVSIF